ncbi:MAG: hypothetical protein U5R31_07375 [Acidimicrobiia bacterium]|nr:hypothetical protein [Acidimicrobiia bacterium]
MQRSRALTSGGPDELLGRLADMLNRRMMAVVDLVEGRVDELVVEALDANEHLLSDLTAVRRDLARIRKIAIPNGRWSTCSAAARRRSSPTAPGDASPTCST